MPNRKRLTGILTAIPTPLGVHGAIDRPGITALVNRLIDAGSAGIVPLGGTGEFTALTTSQRNAMVEATVEACNGRVPVIAGVLFPGLADAVEAASSFTRAGADAIMLVTPYYYRPTQQGIIDYYAQFSDRVDTDIVIYDIPYRTGVFLTPESAAKLAQMTRVIGIKACNQDLAQQMAVVSAVGTNIAVLSGEEDVFPLHAAMGAVGGILSSSNIFPRLWGRVLSLVKDHELNAAMTLHQRMKPAIDALFAEPNPAPIKAALHQLYGFPSGVLSPLLPASEPLCRRLKSVLAPLLDEEGELEQAH